MDTEINSCKLSQIPADRRLVDELYSHGKIGPEAREFALKLLLPRDQWGSWVSRILLLLGALLVLSGIVYFFAFNWTKIPPMVKLVSLQIGFAGCVIGGYFFTLRRLSGQLLLFSGSVLIGVFMATFGQIYQTGADAYQLFMFWSLFTFGFTLISKFSLQWVLWLAITNMFVWLWWMQEAWWQQLALNYWDKRSLIFVFLALFNGTALGMREYLAPRKAYEWLAARWTRLLLTVVTIGMLLISVLAWITRPYGFSDFLNPFSLIGLIGHGLAYFIYRYKFRDMWSLAVIVFSVCIIVVFAAFVTLNNMAEGIDLFEIILIGISMGLITLGIFVVAATALTKAAREMEAENVKK